MELTIKNMETILVKIETELNNQNSQSAKTLMNTYRTLLQQFTKLPYGSSKLIPFKEQLRNQKDKLSSLCVFVEKAISDRLNNDDFKNADNLAQTIDRLYYTKESIIYLLNRDSKPIQNWTYTTKDIESQGRPTE